MSASYQEAIQYLYQQLPTYHLIGAKAYKADLTNALALCRWVGNPQHTFKTVHVAGTNGKGSSSHMLAAILQCAGYKTGLYTSPHLKDFTERIKINGHDIEQNFVTEFVEQIKPAMAEIKPSFFELTVAMAFQYFASRQIDVAVIEVGLGGRLDATNIIDPEISLITNIGYDHMDILGNTLPEIAYEKAGIIKPNRPVVISEKQDEVEQVFRKQAEKQLAPISFANDVIQSKWLNTEVLEINSQQFNAHLTPELKGRYQAKNVAGVVTTSLEMRKLGWKIPDEAIARGINQTVSITGLKGRWQVLQHNPLVICDTGHNAEGIQQLVAHSETLPHQNLHWVFGMVKDKNHDKVLAILPKHAQYYFCQAKIERAMDAEALCQLASTYGLQGMVVRDVNEAITKARSLSSSNDLILVGGSTFVVAEVNNL